MYIHFNELVQKILKNAKNEMQNLKHPFIGSEHVLLSILNNENDISKKLQKFGITYDIFKKEIINKIGYGKSNNNYFIYTPLLKRVLECAIIDTKENNLEEVTINTVFNALLDEGEGVGIRILLGLGIDIDKLSNNMNHFNQKNSNKKLIISECSIDLTKKCQDGNIDPLIGRDKEVDEIINILLRRNKNNPLLIGEAGVGKTAIVEEIANRIVKGNVPENLLHKKILSVSMASLVSGTKYRGEFEERITKILKELEKNDDIIVFIDEVHTIVGAGGAEGAIDASNILKPALARGNIKIIGATTTKEYKESISKDRALNRRFQPVFIKENTKEETINILKNIKKIYEDYHHVIISDEILNLIVNLTDKYIYDKCNPDKSIDILDMVCTRVSLKKNKKYLIVSNLKKELKTMKKQKNDYIINHHFIKASKIKSNELALESKINMMELSLNNKKRNIVKSIDVKKVIEDKTKIPIYEINNNQKIVNIEKYLKEKIIGQDNVINCLAKITTKIMLGLKNNLPYSFLFVGPSGVGKTKLVKEYSEFLKIPLIRLDMSEYKESHTISKIIGSPPGYIGYNDVDTVLEKVKNNPYCIILLDEIEKACSEVINLFLQILDEGIITDSHGSKVHLENTIIIMTSNIGCEKENIGFFNRENNNEIRNVLSTALVNRINTICNFNKLEREDINLIIKKHLKELKTKYHNNHIKVNIDDIVNKSEYEIYGARKALKLLEEKVDDILINVFLNFNKVNGVLNK